MENQKLFISPGNKKMGAIPSVSLPPVISCRQNAPCIKDCYACKMCRIYKETKNAYMRNWELWNENPEQYFRKLSSHMTLSSYFRVHVSGDIPNRDYFYRLVKVVKANKHCKVLMFTKQFEIVNSFIQDGGKIPHNFKIVFSNWNEWKCENPYNFPVTNVIFKNTVIPDNWKICGGNCSECICRGCGCWELKPGETIAFYKH